MTIFVCSHRIQNINSDWLRMRLLQLSLTHRHLAMSRSIRRYIKTNIKNILLVSSHYILSRCVPWAIMIYYTKSLDNMLHTISKQKLRWVSGSALGKRTLALIARFMWPTWGPPGADRTQVAPCGPHEPCYLGVRPTENPWHHDMTQSTTHSTFTH